MQCYYDTIVKLHVDHEPILTAGGRSFNVYPKFTYSPLILGEASGFPACCDFPASAERKRNAMKKLQFSIAIYIYNVELFAILYVHCICAIVAVTLQRKRWLHARIPAHHLTIMIAAAQHFKGH